MADQIPKLLELAARCEAEGPSRELDVAINDALKIAPDGSILFYSSSLDAAVTLLGGENFWRVGNDGTGPDPADFKAEVIRGAAVYCATHTGTASNASMALCAAALRALAHPAEPLPSEAS